MKLYRVDGWNITLNPSNLQIINPTNKIVFTLQFNAMKYRYEEDTDVIGDPPIPIRLGRIIAKDRSLLFYQDPPNLDENNPTDPNEQTTGTIELNSPDGSTLYSSVSNIPISVIDVLFKIAKKEFDTIDDKYILQSNNPKLGGRRRTQTRTRKRSRMQTRRRRFRRT